MSVTVPPPDIMPPVEGTPLTSEQFRLMLPEFTSTVTFPEYQLGMWLAYADQMLLMPPWTEPPRAMAMAYYAAHMMVMSARAAAAANPGGVSGGADLPAGIPGSPAMVQTSKSVGGASVSYDTNLTQEEGAGAYNATTYGSMFYKLMRMAGMAGTQLGGFDVSPPGGPAWPGVIYPKW